MSNDDKKQPVRMCVACRKGKPKQELIRIVRRADGEFFVDTGGKAQGRGAYVCANTACIEKAKKIFPKVMRKTMSDELYEALIKSAECHET